MLIHLPSAEKALSGLKRFGIQLLEVKNETTEDILASIMTIGQAIHKKDTADSLVSSLKEMLKPIKKMSAKKTVIIISRRPGTLKEIYVAGPETFLSQIAEKSGLSNVYGDLRSHYAPVSIESILSRYPDVILDTEMTETDSAYWFRDMKTWTEFKSIPAVISNNVFVFRSSYTHLPAIRAFSLIYYFQDIRSSVDHDQN